jgi:hypothetical protein
MCYFTSVLYIWNLKSLALGSWNSSPIIISSYGHAVCARSCVNKEWCLCCHRDQTCSAYRARDALCRVQHDIRGISTCGNYEYKCSVFFPILVSPSHAHHNMYHNQLRIVSRGFVLLQLFFVVFRYIWMLQFRFPLLHWIIIVSIKLYLLKFKTSLDRGVEIMKHFIIDNLQLHLILLFTIYVLNYGTHI